MPLRASLALSYATALLSMEAGVRRSFNGIRPFANEAPLWLRCNADLSGFQAAAESYAFESCAFARAAPPANEGGGQ
jgi:hypothetical protein